MIRKDILTIADRYRKLAYSGKILEDELISKYIRFADFIEENDYLEDESYETEKDLLNHFKEVEEEYNDEMDSMFSNDDDY